MYICVLIARNTKTKPETSAINVKWTLSLYFLIVHFGISVSFRYFGFVLVSLGTPEFVIQKAEIY